MTEKKTLRTTLEILEDELGPKLSEPELSTSRTYFLSLAARYGFPVWYFFIISSLSVE